MTDNYRKRNFDRHLGKDLSTDLSRADDHMVNGGSAEATDANLFFTFFGLDAIHRSA